MWIEIEDIAYNFSLVRKFVLYEDYIQLFYNDGTEEKAVYSGGFTQMYNYLLPLFPLFADLTKKPGS